MKGFSRAAASMARSVSSPACKRQINGIHRVSSSILTTPRFSLAPASTLNDLTHVRRLSSGKAIKAKSNGLAEVLAGQIHEESSNDEIDQDLVDATAAVAKTWIIKDNVGKGVVTLSRAFKGENIEITFDCQDLAEEGDQGFDMDDMEQEEEGGDEKEGEGEDDEEGDMDGMGGETGINFDVVVTKGDEKIVFNCVAYQQLQIDNVQFVPAGKELGDKELYGGPIFQDLDETLQEAMGNYLADRNIDDALCYFIAAYSTSKEQKEYVNWLNSVMKFVEK